MIFSGNNLSVRNLRVGTVECAGAEVCELVAAAKLFRMQIRFIVRPGI